MSSKCCKNCKFYEPQNDGYGTGRCEYPVPEWLTIGGASPFVMESSGSDCPMYKPNRYAELNQTEE